MKPKSIILKNYKSYGDDEIKIDLDVESIRLISGKSGSGKTAIIDSILWCLYGQSLCKADEVVNRQTGKNCKVEFEFAIGGDNFSVIRYRKHDENNNKVLIFKNNKNISPIKVAEAQQLIQDIIEISPNALVSSVIFSSEIYSSFVREKNSVRLNIFEGILSLRDVNKWNDATKKLLKPITEKIIEISGKEKTAKSVLENITDTIKNYKEKSILTLKNLQEEKKELEKQSIELQNKLDKIQEINIEEQLKKSKAYEEAKKKNALSEHQIKILENKRINLTQILLDIEDLKSKIQKASEINVEEYIKDYENYKEIEAKNNEINSKISELKLQYIDGKKIEKEISELERKKEKLEKEITEIKEEMTCPTCHQKLPEELQNELGLLKSRERDFETTKNRINDSYVLLQNSIKTNEAIDEKINNYQFQIKPLEKREFSFSPAEIREIERNKGDLKSKLSVKISEYENAEKRNNEIDEELKIEKEKIIELGEEPEFDTSYLENLSIKTEEIKKEQNEVANRIEVIGEKAKSTYDKEYVSDLKTKKEKLVNGLVKISKDLKKQEFEERHYKFLLNLFSNKEGGLKKIIISQMIDVFNDEVNKYLPLFFDENIQISFDKNLIEEIKIDNEIVSFNTFSSGEKTRFEFAVAFSLFMLVKNFFSKDVNFIVFDEILDIHLDEESLERVIGVVQDLGNDNSILIISHRPELKEVFTNHILVSKDKSGNSIIEEAA